ncbi:hypothetical protein ACH6EH_18720 [Paenibacillus sp. JSM ZJ436]|uniref:hypothetical protein n=1 Tax=Paenibacillus sp. JSM ZJ436 TaxID=3376190 RepID=UPI0037B245D1
MHSTRSLKHYMLPAVLAGTLAGIFLGLLLKAAEALTSLKVYTLLLNVDYIPVLNQLPLPEAAEFGLHLIVSAGLSLVLAYLLYIRPNPASARQRLGIYALVNTVVGLLLYPTTALSDRTPELFDVPALLVWLLGHVLYGLLLGWLMEKLKPRA